MENERADHRRRRGRERRAPGDCASTLAHGSTPALATPPLEIRAPLEFADSIVSAELARKPAPDEEGKPGLLGPLLARSPSKRQRLA
jgi:hypothetical protein